MKVKERISVTPQNARPGRGWMIACIALIAAFVVGLGSLSVYTVLTVTEQQRTSEQQAVSLAELEKKLGQAESNLSATQKELEATKSELSKSELEASAALSGKDDTISDLKKEIESLKKQIANLKVSPSSTTSSTTSSQSAVVSKPEGLEGLKGKKLVALTFDDGPGPYTERLLDGLKKRGVVATFFVLGTRVNSHPELIKRMDTEGHEVGNHSQNHKELPKLSAANIAKEMDNCAKKIKALIGHDPTVMRCPYGSYNSNVQAYAKGKGMPIIQWDVDTRDWESRNVSAILNVALGSKGVSDGSIVLMHDIHSPTVDATFQLIDKLKAKGYTFVTVSQLLHAKNEKVEAGKVYYEG